MFTLKALPVHPLNKLSSDAVDRMNGASTIDNGIMSTQHKPKACASTPFLVLFFGLWWKTRNDITLWHSQLEFPRRDGYSYNRPHLSCGLAAKLQRLQGQAAFTAAPRQITAQVVVAECNL